MRRGYMGHLTRIANTVVHNLEKGPVHTQISNLITGTIDINANKSLIVNIHSEMLKLFVLLDAELPEDYRTRWETFVEHTLSETNRKNTIDLVSSTVCSSYFYSNTESKIIHVDAFRLELETLDLLQRMTWRAPSLKSWQCSRYIWMSWLNILVLFHNPLCSDCCGFVFKAFSDYQIQQMTANFVDQFGFNDDEFTDHDDNIG